MKKKIWCTAWILSGFIMGGCGAGQGAEPDSELAQELQIPDEAAENKTSETKITVSYTHLTLPTTSRV